MEDKIDSRRFQLIRLQTLITMENYFIDKMKSVPYWDKENTRQLIAILDQSIAGEIEKLCCMDITELSPYHQ